MEVEVSGSSSSGSSSTSNPGGSTSSDRSRAASMKLAKVWKHFRAFRLCLAAAPGDKRSCLRARSGDLDSQNTSQQDALRLCAVHHVYQPSWDINGNFGFQRGFTNVSVDVCLRECVCVFVWVCVCARVSAS